MPTPPEYLAQALAQEYAEIDITEPDAATLGAGLRIARALAEPLPMGEEDPDARLAALGPLPPARSLERHARGIIADAHAAARDAVAYTGPGTSPDRREALGRAARALQRFADWGRFAGYHLFSAAVYDTALAIWPAGFAVEERLWATFDEYRRVALGRPGTPGPSPVALMESFRAQLRAAERDDLLPLLRYFRAAHELNCGRWAAAEGLARGLVRAGARRGSPRMQGLGYEVLVPALGRQDRHAEAAAASLAIVTLEGISSSGVAQALLNVGVAMQAMRLFDAAVEAFDAAARWERHVDERPRGLLHARILRQELELHALRGDRARFMDAYGRLELRTLPVMDRVFVHRDAATGFMRFGDVARAMDELRRAQELSEAYGYHYDWFAIEQEIQRLKHVHTPARDVAELEGAEVELVRNARAAWENLERGSRSTAGSRGGP